MAHTRARLGEPAADQPIMHALEAVRLAPKYLTAIIDRRPTQMTSVAPSDDGGWIVEAEVVEDRRIPPSADMLALYEIELDTDGELLACRRTRRYMRGQPMRDGEQTGDTNSDGPQNLPS